MKFVKAVLFIIVMLIVLGILALVGVLLFADKAVETAVETAGTRMLNVPVEVGRANASVLAGTVDLRAITVANPPGYEGPALLKLQQVDVKTDPGSLLSSRVLIRDMKLSKMEVFIEQKGLQNNLYEVIKPLQEPHRPTGRSLVIDNLDINDVTVHVGLPAVSGQTQAIDLKLASIRMTDLGRNEKMDTAMLISKILLAVAEGIAQQGGNTLPKEVIGGLGSLLDKALDIGKIILGPNGNTPDGQPKDSLGKTVTDGIKDLLGGQKKE